MRISRLAASFFLLLFFVTGAVARAQSAPAAAAIDPAKEADIRRLLYMSAAQGVTQLLDSMMESMRGMIGNSLPAGDYREKLVDLFLQKFRAKADTRALLDLAVPVYDKYLSHEDIIGLIKFYQTPLGQKTLNALPKILAETQAEGGRLGERVGRESMMEVLTEHPELATALEQAVREAQSPR